jgi:hypothetical protein
LDAPEGEAVNVMLLPAQIVLSASLLTMLATGKGFTVVVMPELTTVHPAAFVTPTVTTWPFNNVLVV